MKIYCFTSREAIEKEQARQRYEKLHAEGLARLAIIRKQREEAAQKKLKEQQGNLSEWLDLTA